MFDQSVGKKERREARILATISVGLHPEETVTERARTENISPHGARIVFWKRLRLNQVVRLTSRVGDFSATARVIYCQPCAGGKFMAGLHLTNCRGGWPALSFGSSPSDSYNFQVSDDMFFKVSRQRPVKQPEAS